jgi:hypothetical protein
LRSESEMNGKETVDRETPSKYRVRFNLQVRFIARQCHNPHDWADRLLRPVVDVNDMISAGRSILEMSTGETQNIKQEKKKVSGSG